MKYKRLSPWMLSALSAALVSLGFGACKSNKELVQKREALNQKINILNQQIVENNLKLQRLQEIYENIGRGETVYGGPNNMEEARRRMRERHERERSEVEEQMQTVKNEIDSLDNELKIVGSELTKLNK